MRIPGRLRINLPECTQSAHREDGSGRGQTSLAVGRAGCNRANGYSLSVAISGALPATPRFLNDTTVPGARLPAVTRRRPRRESKTFGFTTSGACVIGAGRTNSAE
jgi:hypothetical protein